MREIPAGIEERDKSISDDPRWKANVINNDTVTLKRKVEKIIIYTVAVIGVAFLGGLGIVKWSFWEPVNIQKDSFVYKFKVLVELKAFPTWGQVSPPLYDVVSVAEGLKPGVVRMRYTSSLNLGQVVTEATKSEFKCPGSGGSNVLCLKNLSVGRYLELKISSSSDGSHSIIEVAYIEQG